MKDFCVRMRVRVCRPKLELFCMWMMLLQESAGLRMKIPLLDVETSPNNTAAPILTNFHITRRCYVGFWERKIHNALAQLGTLQFYNNDKHMMLCPRVQ